MHVLHRKHVKEIIKLQKAFPHACMHACMSFAKTMTVPDLLLKGNNKSKIDTRNPLCTMRVKDQIYKS
jgi:hypothetical protein